jgi:hypothetical protein
LPLSSKGERVIHISVDEVTDGYQLKAQTKGRGTDQDTVNHKSKSEGASITTIKE